MGLDGALPLAYLASNIPKDRATARYFVPFFLSGAVLIGRVLADRVRDMRFALVGIVVLGIAYVFTVWDDLRKPAGVDHAVELADALEEHGLSYGYAPFWDASIVTASSGGRVAVRPIFVRPISPERHAIAPLPWMADANWFKDEPGTFIVIEPGAAALISLASRSGFARRRSGQRRDDTRSGRTSCWFGTVILGRRSTLKTIEPDIAVLVLSSVKHPPWPPLLKGGE